MERHRGRYHPSSRNKRSVWSIATQPYPEAHFATYAMALVQPCIQADTSERGCCPACGAPWQRVAMKTSVDPIDYKGKWKRGRCAIERPEDVGQCACSSAGRRRPRQSFSTSKNCRLERICTHGRDPVPGAVLDPFCGSGTTGVAALRLGRRFLGAALLLGGYRFGALVIDAVRFVPQSRPRLFIVAVRKDKRIPERLVRDVGKPL